MYHPVDNTINIELSIEHIMDLLRGVEINYQGPDGKVRIHPPEKGVLLTPGEFSDLVNISHMKIDKETALCIADAFNYQMGQILNRYRNKKK